MDFKLSPSLLISGCNSPLGMLNGRIADDQIIASSYLSAAYAPAKARLGTQKGMKTFSLNKDSSAITRLFGDPLVSGLTPFSAKLTRN